MKKTQIRSLAAVGLLWLTLGAGCQKDPPKPNTTLSCTNGTCCMQDAGQYDYVETIENEPADLIRQTLIFKNHLPLSNDPKWYKSSTGGKYKSITLSVCSLSQAKIAGLKRTVPLETGAPYPYTYRVWGKVYHDPNYQTLLAIPVLFIYVDRIEEVK